MHVYIQWTWARNWSRGSNCPLDCWTELSDLSLGLVYSLEYMYMHDQTTCSPNCLKYVLLLLALVLYKYFPGLAKKLSYELCCQVHVDVFPEIKNPGLVKKIIIIIIIMIRFVTHTYPPCWVLKAWIQKVSWVLLRALHNTRDLQLYVPSEGRSNYG